MPSSGSGSASGTISPDLIATITATLQLPPDATAAQQSALATFVATAWGWYATQGLQSERLQYLLAQRDAIDYIRGQSWWQVDVQQADVHLSLNQRSLNLQRLRDDIDGSIKALLAQLSAGRGVAVGRLTTTAPVMPTDPIETPLDPNNSTYRGAPPRPYWRRTF